MEPITKLSKVFQGDLIDISILRPVVDSTIAVLEVLQTIAGPQLKQVYDSIQNCIYKEIKLQDTELLRISFHTDQREYITKLTSNLHKRFDPSSLSMLEHLNGLLNPALLDTTTRDLPDCGKESVKAVADFYGKTRMIRGTDFPSVIDPDHTKEDFLHFKYFLKSLSTTPFSLVLITLCAQTIFPDFATMAKLLLVGPIASVPCERAFSAQNLLKTRLQSSLSEGVLESLMRVRLEGPLLKDFDFKRAAMHFCAAKQRRK